MSRVKRIRGRNLAPPVLSGCEMRARSASLQALGCLVGQVGGQPLGQQGEYVGAVEFWGATQCGAIRVRAAWARGAGLVHEGSRGICNYRRWQPRKRRPKR
jgi:hypothetical protein